jgi:hypothetical protein
MMRSVLFLASTAVLILPSGASSQVDFAYYDICGGTTFVFCTSLQYSLTRPPEQNPFFSKLEIKNQSGGTLGGYRGAVITEVRFEGIEQRSINPWGLAARGVDTGPLYTPSVFPNGYPLGGNEFRAWWGNNLTDPSVLSFLSFNSMRSAGDGATAPWSLGLGLGSSCGADLLPSTELIFVTATCGLAPEYLYQPSNSESDWYTSFLGDEGMMDWFFDTGERLPAYRPNTGQMVIVAQDATNPSIVSICRLGVNCRAVPEPGTLLLVATGLAGLAYLGVQRRTIRPR